MNRTEKRRQKKLAEKANREEARTKPRGSRRDHQQELAIQQALSRAAQYRRAGDLGKAQGICQQILHADPNQPVAMHLLGVIAHQVGHTDIAARLISGALAIKPDYVGALCDLGLAFEDMGRLDEAVDSYRRALAISPDCAKAHCNLGLVLHDLGRADEAIASFRSALSVDPDCAEAHFGLAVSKMHFDYDDDVKAAEDAYARPKNGDVQRMYLAFALGKAFEDLRQYEKAFTFFRTANAIKRGSYEYSIATEEGIFTSLKNIFTKDLFSKLQGTGSHDETPIFIVGLPRTGTTLVEQILASHPKVHGGGELGHLSRSITSNFSDVSDTNFVSVINHANLDRFSNAGNKYISMIREQSGTARFITDKMPDNFRFIGMIKLMLPNAKIIHCRRDPRDTCLSVFKSFFTAGIHDYAYDLRELGRYYNLYRDLMDHWHHVLPGLIYGHL